MRISFTPDGWRDYLHWLEADRKITNSINRLIEDIRRSPFTGLGKPEPLKAALAGWWSRRITGEYRLVYRVSGRDEDQQVVIAQCRYHY